MYSHPTKVPCSYMYILYISLVMSLKDYSRLNSRWFWIHFWLNLSSTWTSVTWTGYKSVPWISTWDQFWPEVICDQRPFLTRHYIWPELVLTWPYFWTEVNFEPVNFDPRRKSPWDEFRPETFFDLGQFWPKAIFDQFRKTNVLLIGQVLCKIKNAAHIAAKITQKQ